MQFVVSGENITDFAKIFKILYIGASRNQKEKGGGSCVEDPKRERFDEAYREYWQVMYRVAFHILHGQETAAEDAVQEAFRILAEKYDEVGDRRDLKRWLLKTVEYVAKNESRKAYRHREVAMETIDFPTVEDAYFQEQGLSFPPGLSERDREVLRLSFEERLTQKESAARMGCTVATFRVWLSRAKRRYEKLCGKNSSG